MIMTIMKSQNDNSNNNDINERLWWNWIILK